ncbi:MAG TPA: UDP-glucose/GDP-mannose dehydrogenase family protein [Candidatus Saccharimonadales bacterium]|nr:UDP-glucose/GDP-mannose dehydrogenase family protein [Candidatus Saccharimonadales bacterium]
MRKAMKKVAIVGTGYVGLVSGTCFAELGNDVTCVDIDQGKVDMMRAGRVPIYEPGLDELFERNIREGRLRFTTKLDEAVQGAEVILLALPTPPGEDGSADLSYVLGVADDLGPLLKAYAVIVDKSTVPVGTAEQVHERIAKNARVEFDVVSNPEFLREGVAIRDFLEPDRVVIGASSERAAKVMAELYAPITGDDHPIFFMNERSAELTKYAANSFLATKITFMNQIANLCELVGADVESVRLGVGSDARIGSRFLYPGIGYGGSCFPKDVIALIHTASSNGYDLNLLQMVIDQNRAQQKVLAQKVKKFYGDVAGKTFAMWGLAFKPDTDDIREAPALVTIRELTQAGATIRAYDPEAIENVRKYFSDNDKLVLVDNEFDALKGAEALLITTEWKQFSATALDRIKSLLKAPVVFDGRNIFSLEDMRNAGFYYESIGRPIVRQ